MWGAKALCMQGKTDRSELIPGLMMLHEVVLSGSFSAAGRKLGLSPSAVSRQIDRLEKSLGVSLLIRSTRQLRLTEIGTDAFQVASTLINERDQWLTRVSAYGRKPQGVLRVTAPLGIGWSLLAESAHRFLERYPDVSVDFDFTDSVVDILRQPFELALRVTATPPEDLVARKLFEVSYHLVVSVDNPPPTLPTHPSELGRFDLYVLSDLDQAGGTRFSSATESYQLRVTPRLRCSSSSVLMAMLEGSQGIGFLPNFIVAPLIRSGRLHVLLPQWTVHSEEIAVYLLSRPNRLISPRARAYIDFLREELNRLDINNQFGLKLAR